MARYQKAPDPLPAVKSIQTGTFVGTASSGNSSGEDRLGFVDVSISNVEPSKCLIDITSLGVNGEAFNANIQRPAFARLLNSTMFRVSNSATSTGMSFRWRVVEYN